MVFLCTTNDEYCVRSPIIFIGTPTEATMPGVSRNDDFRSQHFPCYKPEPLLNHAPRLETEGLELLAKFLEVHVLAKCGLRQIECLFYHWQLPHSSHRFTEIATVSMKYTSTAISYVIRCQCYT